MTNTPFPHLPNLPMADLELVCTVDIYDGAISGFVRHGANLAWFDWCPEPDGDDDTRVYLLHGVPAAEMAAAEDWTRRHDALKGEYRLVANPHIYPISLRQAAGLRPLDLIQAEITHHEQQNLWRHLPPTAWCSGFGFPAISMFWLSAETSERFQAWQIDVARALSQRDQAELDRLFLAPPVATTPLDIFAVRLAGDDDNRQVVVRDWSGQQLGEDFVLTGEHQVQWLDSLLR